MYFRLHSLTGPSLNGHTQVQQRKVRNEGSDNFKSEEGVGKVVIVRKVRKVVVDEEGVRMVHMWGRWGRFTMRKV